MHEGCRRKLRRVWTSPGNGWLMGLKHTGPAKRTQGSCWLQLRTCWRKGSCRRGWVLKSPAASQGRI